MDPIKDAFGKVKDDIDFLRLEIDEIRKNLIELCEIMKQITKKEDENRQNPTINNPAHIPKIQTNQQIIPAHNYPLKSLNTQNQPFSTGNEGVPADRQTDQQTDKYIENNQDIGKNSIENAAEMLKSLDNIKKDIRQKFKKLTEQEWLVFSTIYQLDEEIGHSDYRILAERLKLTESSIRDYVARLIKKGIPVDKIKLNNKNIQLNISKNLKQIASLPTIITLRDL